MKKKRINNRKYPVNFWEYNIYNNINNIYKYIYYINKNNYIFSKINKKEISALKPKYLIKDYLALEPLRLFFLNANISIIGNFKRYKLLSLIRKRFVLKPLKRIISNFLPAVPVISKNRFFNYFISWYMSINKREPTAFNLNNIIAVCYDLNFFIRRIVKIYSALNISLKFLSDYFRNIHIQSSIFKLLIKFLYLLNIKKNKKKIFKYLKYYKIFHLAIQQYINFVNRFIYVYKFYLKSFNKLNIIYKQFINIKNVSNIKYKYFSFSIKRSRKQRLSKYNILYRSKKNNIIYYINNIISKFFYYIYLYWLNIYYKTNNNAYLKNNYTFKNYFFILINIYKYYYNYKYKKIVFLKYVKNNRFLLYYNSIFNINNN